MASISFTVYVDRFLDGIGYYDVNLSVCHSCTLLKLFDEWTCDAVWQGQGHSCLCRPQCWRQRTKVHQQSCYIYHAPLPFCLVYTRFRWQSISCVGLRLLVIVKTRRCYSTILVDYVELQPVASKGTPGDEKCVTEIPGDKNKEVKGGHVTRPPSPPVLMFQFLKSFRRSLEARFLAGNSPNSVWRPGSALTLWGS